MESHCLAAGRAFDAEFLHPTAQGAWIQIENPGGAWFIFDEHSGLPGRVQKSTCSTTLGFYSEPDASRNPGLVPSGAGTYRATDRARPT